MEFATFCNICFNKSNLRKIEQTEDLTRILILFIENKILIKEQEIYLCLNCCEKLESYDKFKEMCSRNFIDFRIEYSELKKKLEIMNDPNMEKKLRNFVESKVHGANGTIIMDDSEDPLATPCVMPPPEPKNNLIGTEDKGNFSDYNFHSVKCKTEKEDYEDCKLRTECDLEEIEENSELPLPIEHIKLEPYAEEDFDTNESSNENELMKQSTSTGPYEANNKTADLTTNPIQSVKQGSVIKLKKNERLTGKTPSQLACEICKKTFCKPSNLSRHMRTHTGEKPYACDLCNKSFSHSNTLKRHVTVHTGERRYPCSMCGKRFSESGNLRRHELVHTGERPYTCPVCNKSFRDQTHFKLHERVHTGEKPYECTVCLKRFADPTTYKTHKLTHTGEKPHKCKICNKSFRQSVHLREHTNTHTRAKRYSCDKCKKKFSWASDLRLHNKKSCDPNLVPDNIKQDFIKS